MVCLRSALGPLRRLHEDLPAADFSPLKLKAVREAMVGAGLTRSTINRNVGRIKRVFAWAVENELVPPAVSHGLQAVKGLKAGRSGAREGRKVRPVPSELVEKTLPQLPPTVADMVRVQLLIGMRSTEVCRLRPCDLDRSGDVWVYRSAEHKTAHRGKWRASPSAPQAQAILNSHLVGLAPTDLVFSPAQPRPGGGPRSLPGGRRPGGSPTRCETRGSGRPARGGRPARSTPGPATGAAWPAGASVPSRCCPSWPAGK